MSKVQDLIAQLCPNGVEFRQLQEIFELEKGSPPPSTYRSFGEYKELPLFQVADIHRNGTVLSESAKLLAVEDIRQVQQFPADTVIMSIFARSIKHALIKVPYAIGPGFVALQLKPDYSTKLDMRFVNYYCFVLAKWCVANRRIFSAKLVNFAKFKCIKFPVPPLPVQKEISAFLDNFTNLEIALEAELKARRRQFLYYINQYFSFDQTVEKTGSNSVKWQALGDVGKIARGNCDSIGYYINSGVGLILREHVVKKFDVFATQTKTLIPESIAKNFTQAKKGDLIIANRSTIADEVCKAAAWLGDEDVVVGKNTYVYQHALNPKFVAYFFKSKQFLKQKRSSYSRGLTFAGISESSLCDIKIPVPSNKEQQRIVDLLEGFDLLLNDKSRGLPAEIKARQIQHRFYRNKILSFKEAK